MFFLPEGIRCNRGGLLQFTDLRLLLFVVVASLQALYTDILFPTYHTVPQLNVPFVVEESICIVPLFECDIMEVQMGLIIDSEEYFAFPGPQ